MEMERAQCPRASRIRSGLELLAVSALLVPVLFLLERVVPGIENSSLDELPHSLVALACTVLAVAGVVRIGHALLVHRRGPDASSLSSTPANQPLEAPKLHDMTMPQRAEAPMRIRELHDTPV